VQGAKEQQVKAKRRQKGKTKHTKQKRMGPSKKGPRKKDKQK
jgi:hypothetical protein